MEDAAAAAALAAARRRLLLRPAQCAAQQGEGRGGRVIGNLRGGGGCIRSERNHKDTLQQCGWAHSVPQTSPAASTILWG
jgi:hypothetical protein